MNKFKIIIFSISGLLLGIILIMQFSTPKVIPNSSPIDEAEARDLLIKDFIDEQSYLLTRTKDLRKQIDLKQNEIASQTETYNLKFLEDLKKVCGLKNISGQGVEITLDDNSLTKRSSGVADENGLVHASDLRDLINALNNGQADAISINNQRIVSNSVITSIGNNILINNLHSAPPFIIKAVGNPKALISSIQDKNILLEKAKLKFILQISDDLFIPSFNGTLKNDYINLVE